jgi:hypothetical protein
MDTQPTPAVANDANAPVAPDPAEFLDAWDNSVPEEEPEEPAEQGEEPTLEADDEPNSEEEADDLPPIDAPVSWDAEAKETFKNLPREAQEIVAKRESERERFVQQKSQEATRARTEASRPLSSSLPRSKSNMRSTTSNRPADHAAGAGPPVAPA